MARPDGPFLVQVKDFEGFWNNVAEYPTWKAACQNAEAFASTPGLLKVYQHMTPDTPLVFRATAGPKRRETKVYPASMLVEA